MSAYTDNNWKEMVLMVAPTVRTIYNEEGIATIITPRYKNRLLIKLLVNDKRKNEIKLDLDKIGTEIWNLIDGKRTVLDILKDSEKVGKEELQFQERTLKFLVGLYQNKIIINKT